MAGGKETPRQKMISMMYIVLTALMAMNVSSSILEKFAMLSSNIDKGNGYKKSGTSLIFGRMKDLVKEMGNRPADVEVIEKATSLKIATDEVLNFIDNLKEALVQRTGGYNPVTGYPKNLKDDSEVATLMLTEGKANELKSILDTYMDRLSSITGDKFEYIALDADQIGLFKKRP